MPTTRCSRPRIEAFCGCFDLVLTNAAHAKQNLPLKIGWRDDINIRQPDGPHPRRGQVERDRTAKSSRADAEHFCVKQLGLTLDSHFWKDQVTSISIDLLVAEFS